MGVNQVLGSDQIRYCVHEKIRLDAAERVVDTYDGSAVDRFNGMVTDYNGRCGYFQYRSGALELIQREAESIRNQLEVQGRDRFSVRQRIIDPIAPPSEKPDPVAVVVDPADARNLSLCLSGDYPTLCKHQLLTSEQAQRVEQVELAKHYQMCASGNYPSLCKYNRLTADQAKVVEQSELRENYKVCISGDYPSLCKHGKLTIEQARLVEQAELDKNYRTCVSGDYPSLCAHQKLTADQAARVQQAERDKNYRNCASGQYPSLCNHNWLTEAQANEVAAAELRAY